MNTYKEVKEIAKCNAKVAHLAEKLEKIVDTDGLEWETARFVSLSKEEIEDFEQSNGVTDDYYVNQWTGYCEDDFHGYVYFKTDVPGQFVQVHFDM